MSNSGSLLAVADAVGELEVALQAFAAVKSLVVLEGRTEGMNKLLTVDRLEMGALLTVLANRMDLDIENVKGAIDAAERRAR